MAEGSLTLRIITPDRIVLDTPVTSVRLPGVDGSIGVLKNHAPMVAALDIGTLTYRQNGDVKPVFVSGGFAEVRDNTVRVVSEAGEKAEDIDEERAREAEARARKRLDEAEGSTEQIDVLRAELALRRALVRLETRTHGRGHA
jgi:F-type H+-transporting ATPase subunit epsilon